MSYLRRLGGNSFDKKVTAMLDAIVCTTFQPQFNLTGKDYGQKGRPKTKISFRDCIGPIITGVI